MKWPAIFSYFWLPNKQPAENFKIHIKLLPTQKKYLLSDIMRKVQYWPNSTPRFKHYTVKQKGLLKTITKIFCEKSLLHKNWEGAKISVHWLVYSEWIFWIWQITKNSSSRENNFFKKMLVSSWSSKLCVFKRWASELNVSYTELFHPWDLHVGK